MSKDIINAKTQEYIENLGLQEYVKQNIGDLPLGIKQKLAFLVAVLHQPKIVFLDEPTSGVDPITRRQFWDMIYEEANKGTTVFITTHYMDEAEYCNRISIMVDGKIEALGTPKQLKEEFKTDSIEELFVHLARAAQNIG